MKTCKDCSHYEVCKVFNRNIPEEYTSIEFQCEGFTDRSEIKAEAYKEFAEKLMEHKQRMFSSDWYGEYRDNAVRVEVIERILRELCGEE